MTAKPTDPLAGLRRAAQRVREAEEELATRRRQYLQEIAAAHSAGASQTAIGRELGVSRQRVKQLLEDEAT